MMKYLCIYFLVFCYTTVCAQTYLNLTSTWTESSASCGFSGTCDYLDFTHTLSGDTVFNGKTYYKVVTSGTLSIYDLFLSEIVSVVPYTGQMKYIREEQKRFIQYRTSSDEEIILADFDLEVGDTAVNTYCQSVLIVHHIDTVYLNNELRKRFYFGPGSGGWANKSLIEGVGSSAGLFTYPCHEIGIESGSSMSCFIQDDGLIVLDTAAACNTTGSNELSSLIDNVIHVFPNPFDEIFSVEIEPGTDAALRVELYALTGQLVNTKIFQAGEKVEVDLTGQESGVYVGRVMADKGNEVFRVVKK